MIVYSIKTHSIDREELTDWLTLAMTGSKISVMVSRMISCVAWGTW